VDHSKRAAIQNRVWEGGEEQRTARVFSKKPIPKIGKGVKSTSASNKPQKQLKGESVTRAEKKEFLEEERGPTGK